jgi:hypothetical protein
VLFLHATKLFILMEVIMCARIVQSKEQTHQIPTQTLPIRELDIKAPKDEVARFIITMLYEADDANYEYTLDEFVKHYMLFGPQSNKSHIASVHELKRAILWLSAQKILYVTDDLHVDTHVAGGLHSNYWLKDVIAVAISHFRAGFGKKARHWFYGNA